MKYLPEDLVNKYPAKWQLICACKMCFVDFWQFEEGKEILFMDINN